MKFSIKWFVFRFITTLFVALFAGYKFAKHNHEYYWQGTIRRVQTVDFNLLSHTLPTKLSYLLIEKDIEELQKTLNSSYGYFGLVVTDCKTNNTNCQDQKILYSTEIDKTWKQELKKKPKETLLDSPYNILINPPPLLAETQFTNSRNEVPQKTGKINQGNIIGRVYYVRGIPPEFNFDLKYWIKKSWEDKWFSDKGAGSYYTLILVVTLTGWGVAVAAAEFFQYTRRDRQREKARYEEFKRSTKAEIQKYEKSLAEKNKAIQSLLNEKEELIEELESFNQQIEAIELEYLERACSLFQQISRAQDEISNLSQNEQNRIQNEEYISQLEANLEILENQQQDIQEEYEQKIDELNHDANQKNEQLSNLENKLTRLQKNEEATKNIKQKLEDAIQYNLIYESSIKDYKKRHLELTASIIKLEENNIMLDLCKEENEELHRKNKQLNKKIEQLEEQYQINKWNYNSLKSEYDNCTKNLDDCDNYSSIKGEEIEFYYNEKIDIILEVLNSSVNNLENETRKKYIIQDILNNNIISDYRKDLRNKIKQICKDDQEPNKIMINNLAKIGLEVVSQNKHIKLKYKKDNRHTFAIPKSPSDRRRGSKNMSQNIIQKIL